MAYEESNGHVIDYVTNVTILHLVAD